MTKAFLFDMDGVIVDSEHHWLPHDMRILEELFDERTRLAIGNSMGIGVRGLYEKARALGSTIEFDTLARAYKEAAFDVYAKSPITPGIEHLAEKLLEFGFRLGIVTSSGQTEIDAVVPRLSFSDKLDVVISIFERRDLRPKPSPDGYIAALRHLEAEPKTSIVLEDSNYGIQAGKDAGAFVIGFRGNLTPGYEQHGADLYADTMQEVASIVATRQ